MSANQGAIWGAAAAERGRWVAKRPDLVLAGAAVLVVIVGAVGTDGFMTSANFKAILASVGILGIVAVGMTCITLSGNLFSLSLGVTVTVASMTFLAWLDLGVVSALLLSVALGAAICALQGLIIGVLGANPIIVTIGAGSLQLGAAAKFTNGSAVYPDGGGFGWLAGTVAGLPVSVFVLAGLVLILDLWLYPVGCCFFLDFSLSFVAFARTIFSHMALTTTCETRSFSLSFLILVGFVELLLRPWVLCLLLVGVVFLGLVILVFSVCSCTSVDGVQSFCS